MYNNIPTTTIDAPEEDYLYTDPSQITGAGLGLYTAIKIYKDEIIAVFKGEIIDAKEQHKRVNNQSYFVILVNGRVMDSMYTVCFAKYANDANGSIKTNFKNNSYITLDENDQPCIVAKRSIKIGEEIFCSYGDHYWQ